MVAQELDYVAQRVNKVRERLDITIDVIVGCDGVGFEESVIIGVGAIIVLGLVIIVTKW